MMKQREADSDDDEQDDMSDEEQDVYGQGEDEAMDDDEGDDDSSDSDQSDDEQVKTGRDRLQTDGMDIPHSLNIPIVS